MARTLDPQAYRERREAFVDAASVLIQQKGYDAFSLGDVIDTVGASKGALYHYFDSKSALLDATVERMVETALVTLAASVEDPDVPAVAKLQAVFTGLAAFKSERKDLVLGLMTVWFSEENAIVREHTRRVTTERLTPVLARIIRQGIDEGAFRVRSAEGAAQVFVALTLGANETASRLFLARQAGEVTFGEVESTLASYSDAYERVLGLGAGALTLTSTETLHEWFDEPAPVPTARAHRQEEHR